MPRRKLSATLSQLHTMSKDFRHQLENSTIFRKQLFKKKDALLIPGKNPDELHFMDIGLCKCFWKNEDNDEEIFFFRTAGDFIFLEEFFTEQPNTEYHIVVLEDSELYTVRKGDLDMLFEQYREAAKMFDLLRREVAEDRIRYMKLLRKKPFERYEAFLVSYPGLRGRLTIKDLCSFLGICEKTLHTSKREMVLKDRKRRR